MFWASDLCRCHYKHSPLKKMHIFPLHVLTGKPQGTKALKNFKKLLTQQRTLDKAHIAAADKIASISDIISTENKIETLVKAKGVNNCIGGY